MHIQRGGWNHLLSSKQRQEGVWKPFHQLSDRLNSHNQLDGLYSVKQLICDRPNEVRSLQSNLYPASVPWTGYSLSVHSGWELDRGAWRAISVSDRQWQGQLRDRGEIHGGENAFGRNPGDHGSRVLIQEVMARGWPAVAILTCPAPWWALEGPSQGVFEHLLGQAMEKDQTGSTLGTSTQEGWKEYNRTISPMPTWCSCTPGTNLQ